jgi:argininosuccinate lyase
MREGRFSSPAAEIAQCYSESVSFDRRLYRHDIAGSIAHATALASAGILAADEFEMITRDLQEDKEALFDSVDTVRGALEVFSAMLPALTINRERMELLANHPQLLATDLAEYLLGKGVPFREAQPIVGKLAASGKQLSALSDDEFRGASDAFSEDVREVFDVRKALQRHSSTGSPSPENIERQIARWRQLLQTE